MLFELRDVEQVRLSFLLPLLRNERTRAVRQVVSCHRYDQRQGEKQKAPTKHQLQQMALIVETLNRSRVDKKTNDIGIISGKKRCYAFHCEIVYHLDQLFVDIIITQPLDMQGIVLVLFLVLLGLCEETKQNRFPHKLWLYWHDPDFTNAPIFVQLCVNNMRHYAAVSGWELILANNETIYQYISQESNTKVATIKERLPHVMKNAYPQYLPDIYRTFLLHDNGGMWIDISTIFVRDLSWVQNLKEFELVDSRIAKQPQVVMYANNKMFGANKTIVFDQKSQRDAYLFPGLQFWCMITRPRTKFFSDMIDNYVFMLSQESFESYVLDRKKQGFAYIEQSSDYFAFSNLHIQTLLQRKQKEIDSNPSKFDIKYALEYYGFWTIDSIDSGYSLFFYQGWRERLIMHRIFYRPFSSFPERVKKDAFIKFNGDKRKDAILFFDNAYAMDCGIRDGAFSKESFVSEYLLKYSEDLPFVKKIRSLEARPRGWSESECSSPQLNSTINGIATRMASAAAALLLAVICLVACLQKLFSIADERITKICTAQTQSL